MNAIHVNWSAPAFARGAKEYFVEDFEILTTILSALTWKRLGGSIKLVADDIAIDFYKSIGICQIWDEIKELKVPDFVDPDMFWAAGKLFALSEEKAPVAIIDTDFIVWQNSYLDKIKDCATIHFEDLYPDIYPSKDYFEMKDGYVWEDYNWNIKAANTAFAVFNSQKLLDEYTKTSIKFMRYAKKSDDYLKYMVFCEQRLLPMVADKTGAEIVELQNCDALFENSNQSFTHIWGMKQQMRDNPKLRNDFCKRCIRRITTDFPQMETVIKNINVLKKYF